MKIEDVDVEGFADVMDLDVQDATTIIKRLIGAMPTNREIWDEGNDDFDAHVAAVRHAIASQPGARDNPLEPVRVLTRFFLEKIKEDPIANGAVIALHAAIGIQRIAYETIERTPLIESEDSVSQNDSTTDGHVLEDL